MGGGGQGDKGGKKEAVGSVVGGGGGKKGRMLSIIRKQGPAKSRANTRNVCFVLTSPN